VNSSEVNFVIDDELEEEESNFNEGILEKKYVSLAPYSNKISTL
jgi:hypothetical protein